MRTSFSATMSAIPPGIGDGPRWKAGIMPCLSARQAVQAAKAPDQPSAERGVRCADPRHRWAGAGPRWRPGVPALPPAWLWSRCGRAEGRRHRFRRGEFQGIPHAPHLRFAPQHACRGPVLRHPAGGVRGAGLPAPPAGSLRQKHAVDAVDHAVRGDDVGLGDAGVVHAHAIGAVDRNRLALNRCHIHALARKLV